MFDRKSLTKLTVLTAAALLFVSACTVSGTGSDSAKPAGNGTTPAAGIPNGPIVVGLPIALTGPISLYDGDLLVGAQAAAAAINQAGGVDGHQIKLVTADTKSDIASGGAAALQVIGQGAQFVIPTLDYNFGGGAARTAMQHGLMAISAAGDLRFGLDIGPYMFNLYGGAAMEGAVLADFAQQKGYKTVYMLTDTSIAHETSTCGAFKEVAGKAGISIISEATFQQSDTSIANLVTGIRSAQSQIDAVMMCSYPPGGASALRQLRSGGVTKPIMLDQGFDGNGWESGLPNPGEVYVTSVGVVTSGQDKDPNTAKVLTASQDFAGRPITYALGALTGYASVQTIAEAVKATNSVSASTVTKYLETWRNHSTGMGPTTWTSSCHTAPPRPMQMATVADSKLAYVTTVTPTTLPSKVC